MLIIIQARFSSARLPGKVLRPLVGCPMLGWMLKNLSQSRKAHRVLVATSDRSDDDAIAEYCAANGVRCFRDSLHDVAARLANAAESEGAGAFVRLSGDSPLIDPALVDDVIELFEGARPELATNVQQRTFPKGFSVEAVDLPALRRAQGMMEGDEREHVTKVFYRRPQDFHIANLVSGHDWGEVQLSVDTPKDFALAERMLLLMQESGRHYRVEDIVALRSRCLSETLT